MSVRKTIRFTMLTGMLALALSCETERIIFKGPYHVRFTEATGAEKESYSKPVKIEVHVAGPAAAGDLTVSYSISGNAREGIDYTILGTRGSVTIPHGQYFGYIEVQLINNSNNILRSQDIIFTLTSVNDTSLEVGQGTGGIGRSFTFTIFDDCVLGGNYYGILTAFTVPVRDISITSQNCETYRLSNWNIDVFSFSDPLPLTFIDNFDNTLTIPDQEQEEFPTELATIRGTGVVNPVTRQIIMTVILVDFEDQPSITFTLIPD